MTGDEMIWRQSSKRYWDSGTAIIRDEVTRSDVTRNEVTRKLSFNLEMM